MYRIKRTKQAPPPAVGAAVHYAAAVAPAGNVTAWVKDAGGAIKDGAKSVYDNTIGSWF